MEKVKQIKEKLELTESAIRNLFERRDMLKRELCKAIESEFTIRTGIRRNTRVKLKELNGQVEEVLFMKFNLCTLTDEVMAICRPIEDGELQAYVEYFAEQFEKSLCL